MIEGNANSVKVIQNHAWFLLVCTNYHIEESPEGLKQERK